MGNLRAVLLNGGMGRGRPRSKHKNARVKVQNDIRTYTHIYKQTNIPDFQLTPDSVSLAPLARANNKNNNNNKQQQQQQ